MESRAQILEQTRTILRRERRNPDLDLPEDLKLRSLAEDSLDLIEIVFAIEDHFGVDLPPPEPRQPATPPAIASIDHGDAARAAPVPAPPPINDLSVAVDWTVADLVDWIAAKRAERPGETPA
jgi:acyl carrier protein